MYDFIYVKYVWCVFICDLCVWLLFYCLVDLVGNRIGI